MSLLRRFWTWLWPPIPRRDHNCRDWLRIAPDLCEPYQPVYRCAKCDSLYTPPNR